MDRGLTERLDYGHGRLLHNDGGRLPLARGSWLWVVTALRWGTCELKTNHTNEKHPMIGYILAIFITSVIARVFNERLNYLDIQTDSGEN